MKYVILSISVLTFFLSLPGSTFASDNKQNSNQNLFLNEVELNRKDLPIEVSDSTWQIFEEVQRIKYIEIAYDYSRKNGRVSNNVSAQYWVLPNKYKHGILIYTKSITESDFVHEALHAKAIVSGYPFFYRTKFPERKSIANLENEIQHHSIYNKMNKLGMIIREKDISHWKDGVKILESQISKIPSEAPVYVLNVMGATLTLGGLNRKITKNEILESLPSRLEDGFDLGVQIFKKLRETNMLSIDVNFQFHIWAASLLNLSKKDLVIGMIDFQERNRKYFDPTNGRLLTIKK